MEKIIKRCSCGRGYTQPMWDMLPLLGRTSDDVETIEQRVCPCRSTMAIVVEVVRISMRDLRCLIHEACQASLGWPEAKVIHMYGVPDRLADQHPTDLGNLRLPKGPNSRDTAEDRPLDDEVPEVASYGTRRGVGYGNRSNNASGSGT